MTALGVVESDKHLSFWEKRVKLALSLLTPESFENAEIVEMVLMDPPGELMTKEGASINMMSAKPDRYKFVEVHNYSGVVNPLKGELGMSIRMSTYEVKVLKRFVEIEKEEK